MQPDSTSISVLKPVSLALERTKEVLFRPFDPARWLIIGFSAWLAALGEHGSGGGVHYSSGGRGGDLRLELERALDYLRDNLSWIVPSVIAAVVVIVALGVLVLWVSSRGRFMLLDNVATGRAEVVAPWNLYRDHGNSLFLFRLGLSVAGFVTLAPLAVVVGWTMVRMQLRESLSPWGLLLVAVAGLGALVIGLGLAVAGKLTKDFVVPIMRLRTARCLEAWGELGRLLKARPAEFAVYLLFHVVLSVGIAVAILVAVLATCCVLGCFLAVPYLGTVLLLPVPVFLRSFSALYLAQYGEAYAFR